MACLLLLSTITLQNFTTMNTNANVVTLIDYSSTTFANITKRDASAFISSAIPGDGFGIVKYTVYPTVIEPPTGNDLVVVDPQLQKITEAVTKIEQIQFESYTQSDIGIALVYGEKLLDNQASPGAYVLLSSEPSPLGPQPETRLPNFPVYTCAMGDQADAKLLQEIAQLTKGKAYVAPYPSTMMRIFNDIRGQLPYVYLIRNVNNFVLNQQYVLLPAIVSEGNELAQFNVVWVDTTAQWTASPDPQQNQVSVTLVRPSDGMVLKQPAIVGKGYCIYNVPSPEAGEWQIQIIVGTMTDNNGLYLVSGAFEMRTMPSNAIALDVSAPTSVMAGEQLTVTATATEQGEAIAGLTMTALVEQPGKTKAEILEQYAKELQALRLEDGRYPEHYDDDDKRIAQLRAQRLPETDILEPKQRPAILAANEDGTHQLRYSDTLKPGWYNVQINATGNSAVSGSAFQRSCIASIEVV